MANQVYGRVFQVGQRIGVPSKDGSKVYYRQELVLDATTYDRFTGQRSKFESYPSVEFSNDKCDLLSNLNLGDVVCIDFVLDGRFYEKSDKTQGHINSIRGINVKVIEASQQEQQYAETQQVVNDLNQAFSGQMQQQYQPQPFPQQGYNRSF